MGPGERMGEDLIYICEICQTVLDEHHCKAVCPNCGRMLDCSDLPLIQANAMIDHERLVPRPGNGLGDLLPNAAPVAVPSPPPAPAENGTVANLP